MRFVNLTQFWLWIAICIITVVVLIFCFLLVCQKKYPQEHSVLERIKNYKVLFKNINDKTVQITLSLVISLLIIIIILRPVYGTETVQGKTSNLDIAIVIDTSLSMEVEDYTSTSDKNRLEGSKKYLLDLIENGYDRYVLVSFSHRASVDCPLTTDKQTIQVGIDTLSPVRSFSAQGTSLSSAITVATERLTSTDDVAGKGRNKLIILVSDGEQIGSDNQVELNKAINKANKENIPIITLGPGSITGDRICYPTYGNNDEKFYLYFDGKEVISKLEEKTLKSISQQTNGNYYKIPETSHTSILDFIDKYRKTTNIDNDNTTFKDLYFIISPVIIVIFVIFHLKLWRVTKKIHTVKGNNSSETRTPFFQFLYLTPLLHPLFSILILAGNINYKMDNFPTALTNYTTAIEQHIDNFGLAYHNQGSTYYKLNEYTESIDSFLHAIAVAEENNESIYLSDYYYDLGNAYFRNGQQFIDSDPTQTLTLWKNAIESYEKCIDLNSEDKEAQENLDYVKSLLEQLKKQVGESDNEDPSENTESESTSEEKKKQEVDRINENDKDSQRDYNDNKNLIEDSEGMDNQEYDYTKPSW